jgi:hypothetical protein
MLTSGTYKKNSFVQNDGWLENGDHESKEDIQELIIENINAIIKLYQNKKLNLKKNI